MTDFFLTELDHRSVDGLEVSLLWSRHTNRLLVAVDDSRSGESFEVEAPADRALDVFRHPFASPSGQRVRPHPAKPGAAADVNQSGETV